MSNDLIPTHDQVSALAALVRDGALTRASSASRRRSCWA